MKKVTESDSLYRDLEKKTPIELVQIINKEDHKVATAVEQKLESIAAFVDALVPRMKEGGRLFYIGAGTSGRLGILDASECPPTFGVPHDWVIGLIAGGDSAIRKAVEHAEDDRQQAWKDLLFYEIDEKDTVLGIAASGTTPYVVGGLQKAQEQGLLTACITCNEETPVAQYSDHALEIIVGPEVVTGSTRMKAGTAQKMVLNMITTSTMIRLGRVEDHRMVDMQLSNDKLWDRATKILMHQKGISKEKALNLLKAHGSVRSALQAIND
jgi:N-acetylmuramic acid 6-phosphate etherase